MRFKFNYIYILWFYICVCYLLVRFYMLPFHFLQNFLAFDNCFNVKIFTEQPLFQFTL